jgi:hypothetical protein
MSTRPNGTPTPPSEPALDLAQETEDTRRKLYDAAVTTHFTPTPEEREKAQADPDAWQPPAYTPDQAKLTVHYLYGRWFVAWRLLEEEGDVAPYRRWTVLRVVQDPEKGTLEYHEV